jgi:hypothetical protein
MKSTLIALVFVAFTAACNTEPTAPVPAAVAAPVAKADASVTIAHDASTPAADTSSVKNTATVSATATVTTAPTATVSVTATNTVIAPSGAGSTDTGKATGTSTGTSTGSNADAGAIANHDVAPVPSPGAPLVVNVDAAQVRVPTPDGEICSNGIDKACGIDAGASDSVAPTVELPVCSLTDMNNLPAGVAIPFFVTATDNTGLTVCAFYLNAVEIGPISAFGTNATLEQDITLTNGTNTVFVICFDNAGNQGRSVTLTVKTAVVTTDAGFIKPSADALAAVDAQPVTPDMHVVTADAHVNADAAPAPTVVPDADDDIDTLVATDTLVASADAQAPADAKSALTDATTVGCYALVNNQYMTIPYGQAIVCAEGSLAGEQKCQNDGTLTACVATGTAPSNLRAVIDCHLDKVTLSGDVVDNLFPSSTDETAVTEICLVGDGIGGMDSSNQEHCLPYQADSSYEYVFGNLSFGKAIYRITFFGVTVQSATTGAVRWSNNNPTLGSDGTNGIPMMANDPSNQCSITTAIIIDGDTAKLIVDGTKAAPQ